MKALEFIIAFAHSLVPRLLSQPRMDTSLGTRLMLLLYNHQSGPQTNGLHHRYASIIQDAASLGTRLFRPGVQRIFPGVVLDRSTAVLPLANRRYAISIDDSFDL